LRNIPQVLDFVFVFRLV